MVALDALPPPKIPMESSQAGDQGQRAEGEKDKDKGKKPSAKAKDAVKMKEAEARPRMLLALNRAKRRTLLLKRSH